MTCILIWYRTFCWKEWRRVIKLGRVSWAEREIKWRENKLCWRRLGIFWPSVEIIDRLIITSNCKCRNNALLTMIIMNLQSKMSTKWIKKRALIKIAFKAWVRLSIHTWAGSNAAVFPRWPSTAVSPHTTLWPNKSSIRSQTTWWGRTSFRPTRRVSFSRSTNL